MRWIHHCEDARLGIAEIEGNTGRASVLLTRASEADCRVSHVMPAAADRLRRCNAAGGAPRDGARAAEFQRTAILEGLMVPEVGVEIQSQLIELKCHAAVLRLKVPPGHTPAGLRDFILLPPILTVSAAQFRKVRRIIARRRNFRLVGCVPFKYASFSLD